MTRREYYDNSSNRMKAYQLTLTEYGEQLLGCGKPPPVKVVKVVIASSYTEAATKAEKVIKGIVGDSPFYSLIDSITYIGETI